MLIINVSLQYQTLLLDISAASLFFLKVQEYKNKLSLLLYSLIFTIAYGAFDGHIIVSPFDIFFFFQKVPVNDSLFLVKSTPLGLGDLACELQAA